MEGIDDPKAIICSISFKKSFEVFWPIDVSKESMVFREELLYLGELFLIWLKYQVYLLRLCLIVEVDDHLIKCMNHHIQSRRIHLNEGKLGNFRTGVDLAW